MACLDMFNNEHNNGRYTTTNTMSPRISFSNDFIDSQHINYERTSKPPPSSSDFEFSVTNYNMMAADELFSKGRLLPFKDNCTTNKTLREELLVDDSDDTGRMLSAKPPKGSSSRWKELLGLKRTNIASRKGDKSSNSSSSGGGDGSMSKFHEEAQVSKNSQLRNGGSSSKDMELGM